jgi:3-methylcrotonyl-CoA carboxylase alpha subunit
MPSMSTVLVANRGEIAVRIIRACREMGLRTVAVYSEVDRYAMHALAADEAVLIGPAVSRDSYLSIPAIIAAAQMTGADAIHPGYGFLSENAAFAEACVKANIIFIGPPPAAIQMMGSKVAAKAIAQAANVPVIPGYQGDEQSLATLLREANAIGFPIMLKAVAGGGGKGMRVVQSEADFSAALLAAQREAVEAFGDPAVFLEKLLVHPRHIEFQIMIDQYGNGIHFGERECSIQRRHQKIIEESPSIALTPELRAAMGDAAIHVAKAAGYINAGTVEFLLDQDKEYYFLEMNTRLQVEHPVTEQVIGRDLVHLQVAIAAGVSLADVSSEMPRGHAIEARLYAEDPVTYLPSIGSLLVFDPPRGPGIRLDSGVQAGDEITIYYDPMLAKLVVTGEDRSQAIARLQTALDDFGVLGIETNIPLLRQIVTDEHFVRGETYTDFLDTQMLAPIPSSSKRSLLMVAAAAAERAMNAATPIRKQSPWMSGSLQSNAFSTRYVDEARSVTVMLRDMTAQPGGFRAYIDGVPVVIADAKAEEPLFTRWFPLTGQLHLRQGTYQTRCWVARRSTDNALVVTDGDTTLVCMPPRPPDVDVAARRSGSAHGLHSLAAPMAGTIIQVCVANGDHVTHRQTLVILSAMKMEHTIVAPYSGRINQVACKEGDVVAGGAVLIEMERERDA